MFFRAFLSLHVFSRFPSREIFSRAFPLVTCFPTLVSRNMFSRAFPLVTCFPALSSRYMFFSVCLSLCFFPRFPLNIRRSLNCAYIILVKTRKQLTYSWPQIWALCNHLCQCSSSTWVCDQTQWSTVAWLGSRACSLPWDRLLTILADPGSDLSWSILRRSSCYDVQSREDGKCNPLDYW